MSKVLSRPGKRAGSPDTPAEWDDVQAKDDPHLRSDVLIFVGIMVVGTFVFAPIGLFILGWGLVLLRKLYRQGQTTRPWIVTAVAMFCLIDAATNFYGWGSDLFWSHDTTPVRTLWKGYGLWFDGGYYLFYNSRGAGGTAFSGEKALEFLGILMVFPMRIVAAWAFLRMKRWGLQWMIITSWLYIALWITWVANVLMDFPLRYGAGSLGLTGNYIMDILYFTPFIQLPYLYTVDREQWAN